MASSTSRPLRRGAIVWVDFTPTKGREQRGARPALVVSSNGYLANVPGLVLVLPITSVDRGWPHHIHVRGDRINPNKPSFAMTEQPRTISTERVIRRTGLADAPTLIEVDQWLRDFIGL
jgi:mRNA interferase MazF